MTSTNSKLHELVQLHMLRRSLGATQADLDALDITMVDVLTEAAIRDNRVVLSEMAEFMHFQCDPGTDDETPTFDLR